MRHASARNTTSAVPGEADTDSPLISRDTLHTDAPIERIVAKYAPLFERARQACQVHLRACNHAAVIREVTRMCALDDALVNDLCLMTDQSLREAQAFRNIRRADIELLRSAACQNGNTAACLRAHQLLQNVRERSLLELSNLMRSDDSAAPLNPGTD